MTIRQAALARRAALARQNSSRFMARTSFAVPGGYEGARANRSSLRNWLPRLGSPDTDIIGDLDPLRARTRDLARNAPLVAGALNTHLESIVGPGLVPHPRIDAEFLGLTPEEADAWQKQASRIWWAMAGGVGLDIRRRSNFAQMTWTMLWSWFANGDHFYRRRFKHQKGDVLGLKIQQIEADRISNQNWMPDTANLIEGIEIDDDGAIQNFYVMDRHPGDMITLRMPTWSKQPAYGPTSGLPLMRQIAMLERDGQTRGVSIFAPVIESVKQITRYGGAELDAAVAASFITLLLKTTGGGGLPSVGTGANDAPVGFVGGPASMAQSRLFNLAPAAVVQLLENESVETFNPQRPNSGFDAFFRSWCSIIGVAVGLPHELLIKHFTSSYSASRGALLEAWRGFTTKRNLVVIDQWAQPVYEAVIAEAIARGYLTAPRFFDSPLVQRAYCECQWTGPIMGQLNPLQEAQASQLRIETGTSTIEEETASNTGGDDWERKHAQRVREHSMRVAAGLEPEVLGVTTRALVNEPPDPAGDGTTSEDVADDREFVDGGGNRNGGGDGNA